MKKLILLALVSTLLHSFAFAHIQIGTYSGVDDRGDACMVRTIKKYYEKDHRHPLNERVFVEFGSYVFTLLHPPVVNAKRELAHFNHDVLQGVEATKTGAMAFVIDMNHEEGNDGPVAFHVIENSWESGKKRAVHCGNLKYTKL